MRTEPRFRPAAGQAGPRSTLLVLPWPRLSSLTTNWSQEPREEGAGGVGVPCPCGPRHLRLVFSSESTEQAAGPRGSPSLQPACLARSGVAPRAVPPHPRDSSLSRSMGTVCREAGGHAAHRLARELLLLRAHITRGRACNGPVITDEPASHHAALEACPLPCALTRTRAQPTPAVRVHVPRAARWCPQGLHPACPRLWAGSLQCPLP